MEETAKPRPEDLKPALILYEDGHVGMSLPKQADDDFVPEHVQFIAALMVLMSDPEFMEFYMDRADRVIGNAEENETGGTREGEDIRPARALGEDEIGEWDIDPSDAAIVLTSDWTIHVYAPDIDELGEEDPVPDHVAGAAILAALINTDPVFVDKVWELWEKLHRELEDEE